MCSYYIAELNQYVSEEEAIRYAMRKHLARVLDAVIQEIASKIESDLENNYVISFTFTLPTGQTIKVDAKLTKVVK